MWVRGGVKKGQKLPHKIYGLITLNGLGPLDKCRDAFKELSVSTIATLYYIYAIVSLYTVTRGISTHAQHREQAQLNN